MIEQFVQKWSEHLATHGHNMHQDRLIFLWLKCVDCNHQLTDPSPIQKAAALVCFTDVLCCSYRCACQTYECLCECFGMCEHKGALLVESYAALHPGDDCCS